MRLGNCTFNAWPELVKLLQLCGKVTNDRNREGKQSSSGLNYGIRSLSLLPLLQSSQLTRKSHLLFSVISNRRGSQIQSKRRCDRIPVLTILCKVDRWRVVHDNIILLEFHYCYFLPSVALHAAHSSQSQPWITIYITTPTVLCLAQVVSFWLLESVLRTSGQYSVQFSSASTSTFWL